MKNFGILSDALVYVEDNLCGDILQQDIADYCYCSLSSLQKLFRCVFHMSVGDYINRRRLTNAAKELLETDKKVLDIALKYGFNSAEVFTRAFRRLWNMTPAQFRREWTFSGIFPPIDLREYTGGNIMSGKRFDISELYDYLKSKENTYVISFDIVNLLPINENIGRDAGDKVILEALHRIDNAADDDMIVFRIGGDEFVLVTGLDDKAAVSRTAEKVLSLNGRPVEHNGQLIPVSIRAGAIKTAKGPVRYNELFNRLVDASRIGNSDNTVSCSFAD